MLNLSEQQKAIVSQPLGALCITACAGSGKTRVAVHRLVEMRRLLQDRHGIVALLSFSNVAVDTFRRDYDDLVRTGVAGVRGAVEIDTVDGFITTHILRPHAYRTMGASRSAFLINGNEPFLRSFTVFDGTRSHPTASVRVSVAGPDFKYELVGPYTSAPIAAGIAEKGVKKLGGVGAYTHSTGRYWALQTLKEQPMVLRALVRRYPHLLVDEAQDIAPEHQALLELMVAAGSQLSLIGDCNQGIYEFSGADGAFLAGYGGKPDVAASGLTVNYRSVPSILDVANKIAGRTDTAARIEPETLSGPFYLPYSNTDKPALLAAFRTMVEGAGLKPENCAIVCRSTSMATQWGGDEDVGGRGAVKAFARATVCRDRHHQNDAAFKLALGAIVGLLADDHGDLAGKILRPMQYPELRVLRRAIWGFVRDPAKGLPIGTLLAETQWHPLLVTRVRAFLSQLEADFSLLPGDNIGNKLAKTALANVALVQAPDLVGPAGPRFRVSTVHQVKGESIDAVMYVASRGHVRSLIDGTKSEDGRIGYVAVTRARNLFVLAVPHDRMSEFAADLVAAGYRTPGS